MSNSDVKPSPAFLRLILVPAVITLAVTVLRLTGELRHWSGEWFSTETGGIIPSGTSWIVGITWLAAIFGVYFAARLVRAGQGPRSIPKGVTFAVLGILIFLGVNPAVTLMHSVFNLSFPAILIPLWFIWIVAGLVQYFGWPQLFKALLLYAYAARIPVAIVMFFAMLGNWGTHYDYVGAPPQFSMSPVPRYLWLAFFPQLVAWVGFTITLGSVTGIVTALTMRSASHRAAAAVSR